MRIDHVLLATRDMDAAAARLGEEHGLGSAAGGRHPGWGTGNRIVPVGAGQYLEIIGIVDEAEARLSPLGMHVLSVTEDGDTFMGWCLRPDDFDATTGRLGLEPVEGSRLRPDGVELRWRLAGLPEAMAEPWLPFFIDWEDMASHPSTMQVDHPASPAGFVWLEVGGDAGRLAGYVGDVAALGVRAGSAPRVRAVGIGSAAGTIEIFA